MTAAVRFTSAAEQDLTAAFLWYEEQSAGLGTRFVAQVDDLLARVAETPRQFPEAMSGYRRALLHRFPYGIYFSIDPDEIRVRAVLHLHRDPAHWRGRLPGGAGQLCRSRRAREGSRLSSRSVGPAPTVCAFEV